MVHALDLLFDDRAAVEVRRRVVRGRADELYAAGVGLVVGARALERRQGLRIACPEEIAYLQGWIDDDQIRRLAEPLRKSGYGEYLLQLLSRGREA